MTEGKSGAMWSVGYLVLRLSLLVLPTPGEIFILMVTLAPPLNGGVIWRGVHPNRKAPHGAIRGGLFPADGAPGCSWVRLWGVILVRSWRECWLQCLGGQSLLLIALSPLWRASDLAFTLIGWYLDQ